MAQWSGTASKEAIALAGWPGTATAGVDLVRVAAPPPPVVATPLALNARGVQIGDSYTTPQYSSGLRNWANWCRFFLNGRIALRPGGQLAIAGTQMAVHSTSVGANGVYANNSMLSRIQQQAALMAPEFVLFLGGVNDFSYYTGIYGTGTPAAIASCIAAMSADFDQCYAAMRAIRSDLWLFIGLPPFIRAMAGDTGKTAVMQGFHDRIRAVVAADTYARALDFAAVFNYLTDDVVDSVSHPNQRGGRKMGGAAATVIDGVLASGSVLPATTTVGSTQLDANFALLGNGGTVTAPALGSAPAGKTLATTLTTATVTGGKEADAPFEREVLTFTGTPGADGQTTTLAVSLATPTAASGTLFEAIVPISIAAAGGGAPTGIRQFGSDFAGSLGFGTGAITAQAITDTTGGDLDVAVAGVVRTMPIQTLAAFNPSTGNLVGLRHSTASQDAVVKVGRVLFQQIETVAYAVPFCTGLDSLITGTNYRPQFIGTLSNGSVQTARAGSWTGGAVVFSYAWSKNGVPLGVTTTTYTPTGFVTGDVLELAITGTNAVGTRTIAVSKTFP